MAVRESCSGRLVPTVRTAFLAFCLLLSGLLVAGATTVGGGYVKALWVADAQGLFKLRGDDAAVLVAGIGAKQTRAVAVDPDR
ncbi:MAG: hypothetical protein HQL65_15785, partial [Magnetococcales bacterium]|nr:hypothetical protein [Magnetococcales bacterium]